MGATNGSVQIGRTTYARSIWFQCTGGAGAYFIYNVADFNFLDTTIGVPNNSVGAANNTATISFLKNGSTTQLAPPVSDVLGQTQPVHINLQGADQLEIQCTTNSSQINAPSMEVALGNATFGPS